MTSKTTKYLELRIKSTFDGDQALKRAKEDLKILGAEVKDLSSRYDENAKSGERWAHTFKIAGDNIRKLTSAQKALTDSLKANGDTVSSAITQKPLATPKTPPIEAARLKAAKKANSELLAANNRTIKLEKLTIENGAHDIAVIREKLAQKERSIAEKLQKDLADIAKKGASGQLKNIPAARTKVFAKYRRDILDIQRELVKANAQHATAQAHALQRTKEIAKAQKKVVSNVRSVVRAHRHWSVLVAEGIGLYRVVSTVITGISTAIRAIPKVGIDLQTSQAVLEATLGSATAAAGAFKALDKEAERTGINIVTLRENFRNLNASMTLAGETSKTAWRIFQDLNTVSTALHFSGDKTQLTFLAISQIFNKTKVQSEELVKQLGNLLPGAFASFQKANEKAFPSTQALVKAMSQGTVVAHKTVKNFLEYYSGKFLSAFVIASQGLQANVGRTQTSFIHLGEAIFDVSKGPMTSFLKAAASTADALTDLIKNTDALRNILKGAIIVLTALFGGVLAKGLGKVVSAIKGLFKATKTIKPAIGVASGSIVHLSGKAALAKNAMAALTGAIGLFTKSPVGMIVAAGLIIDSLLGIGKGARDAENRLRALRAEEALIKARKPETISLETRVTDNKDLQATIAAVKKLAKERAFIQKLLQGASSPLSPVTDKADLQRRLRELDSLIAFGNKKITDTVEIERLKQAKFEKDQHERELELEKSFLNKKSAAIKQENEKNLKILQASMAAEFSLEDTTNQLELQRLQFSYDNKLIAAKEYYKKKRRLLLDDLAIQEKEFALQNGPITQGDNFNPEAFGKGIAKFGVQKQLILEKLQQEQKLSLNKAVAPSSSTNFEKERQKTEIEILKLKGQSFEATKRELILQEKEKIASLHGNRAKINGLKELIHAKTSLEASQNLFNDRLQEQQQIQSELTSQEAIINAKESAGIISRAKAFSLLQQKRKETLASLKENIVVLQDLADAQERVSGGIAPKTAEQLAEAKRQAKLLNIQIIQGTKKARREINILGVDIHDNLVSNLGNAFAGFIEGTKSASQAMRDFASNVLKSIAQIAANSLAERIIGLGIGLIKGGSNDKLVGGGSGISGTIGNYLSYKAKGGAYTRSGEVTAFANGGIVSSPTLFKFAKGTGLMGEAGPEAIMPLKRDSSGRLGIIADVGSTKQSGNVYNIAVTVTKDKNETSSETGTKVAAAMMRKIAQQEIANAKRPGNQLNKITAFS